MKVSHVLAWQKGLQEESSCTQNAHKDKDPQKDPVNHHGNILPVILDLKGLKEQGIF